MLLFRILRSLEDGAGGAAPDEETVTISRLELDALRGRHETSRPSDASPKPDSEDLESRFAKEIAERERQSSEWEHAFKSALRDREVATALAGKPLVSGAAAQLIRLWRDEFSVHEERGEFHVCSRDGRPIVQAVTEMLASAEFAHFCQPSSRGGVAQRGTSVGPAAPAVVPMPRNLGEAVIQQWRETVSRPSDGSSPIGLRRRR
jgi:hypothetical protein